MKRHSPDAFTKEIWEELNVFFWRNRVDCLPGRPSFDGLDPVAIETTKRGVEVRGGIWFLTGGRRSSNPRYELVLCLSRPRFSSIASVTLEKLRSATISEATLEEGLLSVVLA